MVVVELCSRVNSTLRLVCTDHGCWDVVQILEHELFGALCVQFETGGELLEMGCVQ